MSKYLSLFSLFFSSLRFSSSSFTLAWMRKCFRFHIRGSNSCLCVYAWTVFACASNSVQSPADFFLFYWIIIIMKWEHIYSTRIHIFQLTFVIFISFYRQTATVSIHTHTHKYKNNNWHLKKRWIDWFVQTQCRLFTIVVRTSANKHIQCMFVGFNNEVCVSNQ